MVSQNRVKEKTAMCRHLLRAAVGIVLIAGLCATAAADYKADIGYTQLLAELGAGTPTGAGVPVTQVEANTGTGGSNLYLPFVPPTSDSQFTGKTLSYDNSGSPGVSGHATGVGYLFYGNTESIAPGITSIRADEAGTWLQSGFLNTGSNSDPLISAARVANHSWVGYFQNTDGSIDKPANIDALGRVDWVINRDEYIQVVGMDNGTSNQPLLGSSFNAIAVGLSNGNHAQGSYDLTNPSNPNTIYTGGRTRPDLVVPQSYTSAATPVVAATAALLVQAGHSNPALSTDPAVKYTTNRAGDTIYNAERSEVVKAALMAGASREALLGYTVNTTNGLNSTFGAGQLNIYNSYHIIAAGEQNSREDGGQGSIGRYGFDYDPYFGGKSSSNRVASYYFAASGPGAITASLVWNLDVTGTDSASFYHLGLYLYDDTTPSSPVLLSSITGLSDNTENLWFSLTGNHNYLLQVQALTSDQFLWDYALAWDINTNTVPVPATILLFGPGLVGLAVMKRR